MPKPGPVAIIYNPNSTGNAELNARQLQDDLRGAFAGITVDLLPTRHAGHARDLAYDYARKHGKPLVVSASGDGGYNEVINGALAAQLEGAHPTVAVLPSGNANDHARTMQEKPLFELIKSGAAACIDVLKVEVRPPAGEATERYAHAYVGLGLTPSVAVELNKHTLNSLKEAWIVLRTFWGLRPVEIAADGKKLRLDSLICSTVPEMAKVLTISTQGAADDELFELVTFEHNRKFKLLFRLVKGMFTTLGARSRLRAYECTLLRAAPIQLDGEVMELEAGTQLKVRACPRLLRTFV